ncbi:MAG: hypothetical protein LUD68_01460 [Rikenellaceae bacterium]|nr:hypothetical protein [Rikenellaceae bacterium]
MNIKLLFLALWLSFISTACTKDDSEPPYFPEGKIPKEVLNYTGKEGLLPSRWVQTVIYETPTGYKDIHRKITEFNYDEKNRLVSWVQNEERNLQHPADHTSRTSISEWLPRKWEHRLVYHKRGYLIREEVRHDEHPERTVYYGYKNGLVYVKDYLYHFQPAEYFSCIEFDTMGRITRKVDPTGLHYQSFMYDKKGNICDYKDIIGGDSGWIYTHEYDDYPGAFSCSNTPQWYLATTDFYGWLVNNKTSQTPVLGLTYRIEYEYNEQGYPV